MSELITNIEWYGNDFAEGHTKINGKFYKVVVESED